MVDLPGPWEYRLVSNGDEVPLCGLVLTRPLRGPVVPLGGLEVPLVGL